VARVILDASVVIALRSPQDAHAELARLLVLDRDELIIHPVTLAETLVVPARAGIAKEVRERLIDGIGMQVWRPDDDEPVRVAELRAETRVALPDCYVLALAELLGHPLATFDARLAAAATARGVQIAGVGD
jgi:predicted nucleic acid-binding protein